MSELSRIGVAIDSDLLDQFDKLIAKRGYTNRSEAFRDLIRNELVEEAWLASETVVFGTITLVYDHHVRLDHDNCLEVILVKGKAALIQKLANGLIAMKGVKHGRLTATASGKDLP